MKYYTYEGQKIRTDAILNKAYVLIKGEEKLIPKGSKLIADAVLENKQITEKEYESVDK